MYIWDKKHYISLDLLRILACFLVVGIHCEITLEDCNGIEWIYWIIFQVERIGLPVFFLLSATSMMGENQQIDRLGRFYYKKILNIGIPFFLYSVGYHYLWSEKGWRSFFSLEMLYSIPKVLIEVCQIQQSYHLWYMYTLMGLYAIQPFLKKWLNEMDYTQIKKLEIVCIFILTIKRFSLVNVEFCFDSWVIYYIIGYGLLRKETKKYHGAIIIQGVIAFIISILINMYIPDSRWATNIWDLSPFMIMQAAALFVFFLQNEERFGNHKFERQISFLKKYTYLIYLGHPLILFYVNMKYIHERNSILIFFLRITIVFFMTLFYSIFAEKVVLKPTQYIIDKLCCSTWRLIKKVGFKVYTVFVGASTDNIL